MSKSESTSGTVLSENVLISDPNRPKRNEHSKSDQLEELCLKWFQAQKTVNISVTRAMLMDQAKTLANEKKLEGVQISHSWLNRFIQRKKLEISKPDAVNDGSKRNSTLSSTPLYQAATQPISGELLYQGAEARLFACSLYSASSHLQECIVKERFVKSYRHPILDSNLSLQRLRAEIRQLLHCRKLGLDVPAVLQVDLPSRRIWLSRIGPDAQTLNEWFEGVSVQLQNNDSLTVGSGDSVALETIHRVGLRLQRLTVALGCMLGRLHANHVVHGDLTMANILVRKATDAEASGSAGPRLAVIDFGLSSSVSHTALQRLPEEKAVDLYVFERALINAINHQLLALVSTEFPQFESPESFMVQVLDAYRENYPTQATSLRRVSDGTNGPQVVKAGEAVDSIEQLVNEVEANLAKLNEVRLRGRKRLMIG